jgi:hypothetical protein
MPHNGSHGRRRGAERPGRFPGTVRPWAGEARCGERRTVASSAVRSVPVKSPPFEFVCCEFVCCEFACGTGRARRRRSSGGMPSTMRPQHHVIPARRFGRSWRKKALHQSDQKRRREPFRGQRCGPLRHADSS